MSINLVLKRVIKTIIIIEKLFETTILALHIMHSMAASRKAARQDPDGDDGDDGRGYPGDQTSYSTDG